MSAQPAISVDHARAVKAILAASAPRPCRIWVFGSRASGKARRFSDLDLAVDAGRQLTFDEEVALQTAFTDSSLPWRVDVVDLNGVSDSFRQEILAAAAPFFDVEEARP